MFIAFILFLVACRVMQAIGERLNEQEHLSQIENPDTVHALEFIEYINRRHI